MADNPGKQECGCVLDAGGDWGRDLPMSDCWIQVKYCPMHRAAPALMDGLIACLDALDINAAKNEDLFAWQRRDGHAVMREALGLPVAAKAKEKHDG